MRRFLEAPLAFALAFQAGAGSGFASREDEKPQETKTDAKNGAKPGEKEADEKKKEEPKDRWLAILNGDVRTVTNGALRGATVLCKNGKIFAVGFGVTVPPEAATIDAAGLTVYPGLIAVNSGGVLGNEPIELSSDVYSWNMTYALACGWTTMVSGSSAGKLTYGTLEGLLLARDLWLRMSYRSGDERRRVREDLEKARDFLRQKKAWELEKAAGGTSEEPKPQGVNDGFLKLLGGDVLARFDASTAEDLSAIAKLVTEYGFKAVVFGAEEGWVVAGELGRAGISCVVTPRVTRQVDRRSNRANGATIENAAILHRAGVKVAVIPAGARLSTDGLVSRDLRTPTIEAAFAVRGGLPPEAGEESITINAARVCGVGDRIGSIEVGKDADLILLDGDLLHYESIVQYTIVNGRLAYDKAREPMFQTLRPRESTYKEPPPPPEEKPEEKPEAKPEEKPAEPKEGEPSGEKKEGEQPPKEGDKPGDDPKPAPKPDDGRR